MILLKDMQFYLYVQEYNERINNWESWGGVSVYDTLQKLKRDLYHEYYFACVENAGIDMNGNEIYLEDVLIPISYIKCVTDGGISYFDIDGNIAKIDFEEAFKNWCIAHKVINSDTKYVCDRMCNSDGRRMIFYTKSMVVFIVNTEQEAFWREILNNIKTEGYYTFDIN